MTSGKASLSTRECKAPWWELALRWPLKPETRSSHFRLLRAHSAAAGALPPSAASSAPLRPPSPVLCLPYSSPGHPPCFKQNVFSSIRSILSHPWSNCIHWLYQNIHNLYMRVAQLFMWLFNTSFLTGNLITASNFHSELFLPSSGNFQKLLKILVKMASA